MPGPGGVWRPPGRPLPRAARILLECIPVRKNLHPGPEKLENSKISLAYSLPTLLGREEGHNTYTHLQDEIPGRFLGFAACEEE